MKILLSFFVFLIMNQCNAQALYAEGFGRGLVGSINYEHQLGKTVNGPRCMVGFGYAPDNFYIVPASVSMVLGKKSHHLELALGVAYSTGQLWIDDDPIFEGFTSTGHIHYRYQKPDGRFFFKIGTSYIIWPGVGFGYYFF